MAATRALPLEEGEEEGAAAWSFQGDGASVGAGAALAALAAATSAAGEEAGMAETRGVATARATGGEGARERAARLEMASSSALLRLRAIDEAISLGHSAGFLKG